MCRVEGQQFSCCVCLQETNRISAAMSETEPVKDSTKPTQEDDAATAPPPQINESLLNGDGGGEGPIVSLQELLAEQEELEKDYAAVLGGSDEKCCTYSKVTCACFDGE